MKQDDFDRWLQQGLVVDTAEIPSFIEQIPCKKSRKKIQHLLSDETALTQHLLKTAGGLQALQANPFEDMKTGDTMGQVVIKKLLGKGGMGCVFLGFDQKLKRHVALKTIRAEYLQSPLTQQRFEQEALVLSQINHPCICQIYQRIESDRGNALVLEYIDGQTLGSIDLDQHTLLQVLIDITSALAFAHDHGIIHRDLKPDNIMLTDTGQIKILDFGIAKLDQLQNKATIAKNDQFSTNLTQHGSTLGTLSYMSPEQLLGKGISEASDVYSMGIIMYELFTGQSPYECDTAEELHTAVSGAQLGSLQAVPKPFRQLILQSTQKIPIHRPTAQSLRDQLLAIQRAPERRRRKHIGYAVLSVMLFLMGLLIWQQYGYRQEMVKQQFINQAHAKIEEIRVQLDRIYTLPKHDVTIQLDQFLLNHEQFIDEINDRLDLSPAEKSRLLGESWYAIDDYEKAVIELQDAWQAGLQDADSAFKLVHSHSMVYRNRSFALTSRKKKIPESDKKALLSMAKRYMAFVQQSDQDVEAILYAYEAYFEGNYQQALQHIDVTKAKLQGKFRHMRLLGLVYRGLYEQAVNQQQTDLAQGYFDQSQAAYQMAIDYGRSYARNYSDLCALYQHAIRYNIQGFSQQLQISFDSVKSTCQSASEVYPKNSDLIGYMTGFLHRYAEWLMQKGQDATEVLDEALLWNKRSFQHYQQQNRFNANTLGHNYLDKAIILDLMALQQVQRGEDPSTNVQKALEAYQTSLENMPHAITPITSNMLYAIILQLKHQLAIGQSLLPHVQQAQVLWRELEASKERENYNASSALRSYGDVHQLMAFAMLVENDNQSTWLEQSNQWYQQALTINDKHVDSLGGLAKNALFEAQLALRNDTLTQRRLDDVQSILQPALNMGEQFHWIVLLQANLSRLRYQLALQQADTMQTWFEQADVWYQQVLKLNNRDFQVYYDYAVLYWLRARHERSKKLWQTGLNVVNMSLQHNARCAKALLLKSRFLSFGVQQDWTEDESAKQLKQQALSINPNVELLSLF